jgi:HEAT repeat protein
MSSVEAAPSEHPEKRPPSQSLPPVEAPTGTFILQLFLIPLLIVSIVVLLWLLFSWLAQMGRDNPQDLVKSLRRGDDSSWQRAYELADLLRSSDPKYDALRSDKALAQELASLLEGDFKVRIEGPGDKVRVMRRMYLCRALGSFNTVEGLPILKRAAKHEEYPTEVEVRYSALEAIATLAHNVGPEELLKDPELVELVIACSREQDDGATPPVATTDPEEPSFRPHAELRAVAAYTLGILGGDQSLARLRVMLHDAYPNARFNAATGLARHGDAACMPVLKEMLDPDNEQVAKDERYADDQHRKRTTVLLNGIRATVTLAEANPGADISVLKESLSALADSPLEHIKIDRGKIQAAAVEAQRLLP